MSTREVLALLGGLSLVVACADTPSADNSETDGTGETDGTDGTGETQTTVEEAPYEIELLDRDCPFVIPAGRSADCHTLRVPLDRSQPEGDVVELPIAVLHPSSGAASRPPVVYLHGGPGSSAFANADRWFGYDLSEDGDFIVLDQRGSGMASPSLDCPEVEAGFFEIFSVNESPENEAAIMAEFMQQCRDRLAQETDLDAFDTQANADDIEDLRVALGHESWSLYGVSYGTRLAMSVIRRHPEGLRNVVLDSVYPPEVGGVDWMVDISASAMDRLVAGCLEEPECGGLFPELGANLDSAVAALDAQPYIVAMEDSSGVPHELHLSGADLYAGMFNALYDIDLIPLVPFLIYSASQGDFSFLPEFADRSIPFLTTLYEGARLSIDCADGGLLIDDAQLPAAMVGNPEFSTLFIAQSVPFCSTWDVEAAPPEFIEPVQGDVPTMILAGEYDPITPVSQSQLAADSLDGAQLYVFPGLGHGPSRDSDCAETMTRAFLRESTVADSSCWSSLSQDTF